MDIVFHPRHTERAVKPHSKGSWSHTNRRPAVYEAQRPVSAGHEGRAGRSGGHHRDTEGWSAIYDLARPRNQTVAGRTVREPEGDAVPGRHPADIGGGSIR